MDVAVLGIEQCRLFIRILCFNTGPISPLLESNLEAYGCLELFSGTGWVTKQFKAEGIPTASFDILLGDAVPGKQNAMNLLSDAGFACLDAT